MVFVCTTTTSAAAHQCPFTNVKFACSLARLFELISLFVRRRSAHSNDIQSIQWTGMMRGVIHSFQLVLNPIVHGLNGLPSWTPLIIGSEHALVRGQGRGMALFSISQATNYGHHS